MYNVDGSGNSFHCFFSGCHKRLRKLNHEEFTLKYRPEFAFNCMQAKTGKNFKTFDRTFGGGGGVRVKRGHVAASSAWVKKRRAEWHRIQVKWVSKCNDQCREREERHIFKSKCNDSPCRIKKFIMIRWAWFSAKVDVTLQRMYVTTRLRSKMTLFSPFFFWRNFFFS